MADRTYLVRGFYPGLGFRYWYSSSSTDLFTDYPTPDSYYPADVGSYTDVIIYDISYGTRSASIDGYALIDNTQVSGFTGTITAGEPLVLTSSGLVKAYADTNDTVYGLATETMAVTTGVTVIPTAIVGIISTDDLGAPSLTWTIGDQLYLATAAMGGTGITNDIATLSSTSSLNVIKIGTWSNTNVITISISYVMYTG